jgi:arylsulfatase A-like enzyme
VLDRTYVFFTSDNGYLEGEHRIVNAKEHLYEPSIRVPLLVRGPGIERGIRLRQPTVNVDVAPTIAAAARAIPTIPPDGRSLLPLLADPSLEWGRDVLLERGPGAGLTGLRLYTALRTPRYVYAEHATGERELYDLAADPYELASRHEDPEYAAIREVLAARLAKLRDCVGAACAQGPELALDVRGSGGCVSSASVRGGDEKLVARVDLVESGPRVRAQVELVDGRRVTLTATARRCS